MEREALKLALEALEAMQSYAAAERKGLRICDEAITAIKEALAQPAQEPVAYPKGDVVGPCICGSWPGGTCLKCPLIAAQPAQEPDALTIAYQSGFYDGKKAAQPAQEREWVGLTDEDCTGMSAGDKVVALWANRILKEKNS